MKPIGEHDEPDLILVKYLAAHGQTTTKVFVIDPGDRLEL